MTMYGTKGGSGEAHDLGTRCVSETHVLIALLAMRREREGGRGRGRSTEESSSLLCSLAVRAETTVGGLAWLLYAGDTD